MIYDAALLMASAQSSTVSVASTDYIDALAAGNDYKGCIFNVRISTAAAIGQGAPTVQYLLQTSSVSTFTDATTSTLCASAVYQGAALTAGKTLELVIPSGAKRYLRGYQLCAASTGVIFFTALAFDMFITEDSDVTLDKRKLLNDKI